MSGITNHCWSEIGVWTSGASPTCPKLKQFVHCSNCDIFVANGRKLFEGEPSADYIESWTKLLAAPQKEAASGRESLLVFRLGEEWLAFPALSLKTVYELAPIHAIPHKSDALLLGLVNIGGALQLCFSLKALLGIDSAQAKQVANPLSKPRLLVLERAGQIWVFPADEVLGIFDVDSSKSQNIPATVLKANPAFIRKVFGLDGRSVGIVDDELAAFALQRSLQ